jgi:uncharacterized protein (TIGR03083 family)
VSGLTFERHCAEIVAQTDALRAYITPCADLTRPVPTCPGWNVSQLIRHVDGGHRWAAELVGTAAAEPTSDVQLRNLSGYLDEDPASLDSALADGAAQLAAVLRTAGPDAQMWTPVSDGTAAFYARRFTHETAVHRADAALALGADYALDGDVAVDAVDEWLELGSLPMHFNVHPWMRELLGPDRTIGLRATDVADGDWLVDLNGDAIAWRRGAEAATAVVSGPVTDLLLLIYRRRPAVGDGINIAGDAGLVHFWLERVAFG